MAKPNKGAASKAPGKKASAKKASSAGKPGAKPPASTKPVWQKLFVKGGTLLLLSAQELTPRHHRQPGHGARL